MGSISDRFTIQTLIFENSERNSLRRNSDNYPDNQNSLPVEPVSRPEFGVNWFVRRCPFDHSFVRLRHVIPWQVPPSHYPNISSLNQDIYLVNLRVTVDNDQYCPSGASSVSHTSKRPTARSRLGQRTQH